MAQTNFRASDFSKSTPAPKKVEAKKVADNDAPKKAPVRRAAKPKVEETSTEKPSTESE